MTHPTTHADGRLQVAWKAFETKMAAIRSDFRGLLTKVDSRTTERRMAELRKTLESRPRV